MKKPILLIPTLLTIGSAPLVSLTSCQEETLKVVLDQFEMTEEQFPTLYCLNNEVKLGVKYDISIDMSQWDKSVGSNWVFCFLATKGNPFDWALGFINKYRFWADGTHLEPSYEGSSFVFYKDDDRQAILKATTITGYIYFNTSQTRIFPTCNFFFFGMPPE